MPSIDSAPRDGSILELLVDGEWIEASWDQGADDGSPYGTEGWAQAEGGYVILDAERWRPADILRYSGTGSPLSGHSLRQPIVVIGLGFGDEAKGATVDYLSSTIPDAAAVVRWSGGANAAHNVRHGHRHHAFRQFGSGTLLGLPTYLTDRVVVNLQILMAEAVELEAEGIHDPLSLLRLHGDALITTPIHTALNRAREILRGRDRHGSCGLGIGETVVQSYAESHGLSYLDSVGNFEVPGPTAGGSGLLTARMLIQRANEDLGSRVVQILEHQASYAELLIKEAVDFAPELADELQYGSLEDIAEELISTAGSISVLDREDFGKELEATMARGTVIFEGSQGLLLDEQWGFHPHTTWAQTEPSELFDWLYELGHRPYLLGLTRSYMTRHGAGPLPSEGHTELTEGDLPADDNSWGRWQGGFRVAPLDLPLLHYSKRILADSGIELNGLSISHLDGFGEEGVPVAVSYGAQVDPSKLWHFGISGDSAFPTRNSDEFLSSRILTETPEISKIPVASIPEELTRALSAPTVLLAHGPSRRDRKFNLPQDEAGADEI